MFSRNGWLQFVAMLVVFVALAGCATSTADSQYDVLDSAPGELWVETSLYFGLGSNDGGNINSDQWNEFLDEVVTPRFPDGLTVLAGRGQYTTNMGKLIKENCRVIVILHKASDKASRSIEEIRAAYKAKMKQESVLRVTTAAKVAF